MTPRNATSRLALPVSERDHIWGSLSAPITLVEYGDYECPHCRQACAEHLPPKSDTQAPRRY